MFKRTLIASLMFLGTTAAHADPGVFFGVAYAFGHSTDGLGLSLKVMSTNKEDHFAAGAGVTYYPMMSDNKVGVDLGVGYNFKDLAVTAGWDFLHSPQVAVGYVNTKKKRASLPPPPPPPPPVPG